MIGWSEISSTAEPAGRSGRIGPVFGGESTVAYIKLPESKTRPTALAGTTLAPDGSEETVETALAVLDNVSRVSDDHDDLDLAADAEFFCKEPF